MDDPTTPGEALRQAVSILGGQAATARFRGVTQPTVWYWLRNEKLPAEHVLPVAEKTGVSASKIRPDLYPMEAPHILSRVGDNTSVDPSGSVVACDRAAFSHRKGDA